MRHGPGPRVVLAAILLWAGVPVLAGPGSAGAGASPYEPAKSCGRCHDAIFKSWSESPHSRSAASPAYFEALRRTVETATDKDGARRACVWCHAPTTLITGDLELQQPISREGVTCDFCHTVVDVDMEKAEHPFVLEPGRVKRGPFEYSRITGHASAYSFLHRASPLLCASCHEFTNANGVVVLSTYSDWKEGPYPARGVPCQDCHMAPVPGSMVKGGGGKDALRVINLHRVVGGSAQSQLKRGLDLTIESVRRSGGSAEVSVVVANVAAGHPVPGGLATKSLILSAGAEMPDGRVEHRQERVYRRELKDAGGRVLGTVSDLFLRAASVGRDNRIRPKESRRERFGVPVPQGARAVVVRLEYRDSSDPRGEPRTTLITEARHNLSTP
ncbi:MAG: hypothetical protein HY510_01070 [Acidobacteria bacterium]|nr:hypothetical protein [Acidobacteriota bacterium]